ncbi:MAG: hypothetical protein Fur0037_29360 [Planctomycetota bacterium]
MKRFLLGGLAIGLVLALCGPLVVRLVLPQDMEHELMRALGEAWHRDLPAHGSPFTVGELAAAFAVRLAFGYLAAAALLVLSRKRSSFRAARICAFWLWLLGYLAIPLYLYVACGLKTTLLLMAIGYGLVETNAACLFGVLVLARGRKARKNPS